MKRLVEVLFMRAMLALEDGTVFTGRSFGAVGEKRGEVVFNTGMTGYQEILTDPSNYGQIVVMTYPLIGNYGIGQEDFPKKSYLEGFVIYEECARPSNCGVSYPLGDFLAREGVIGLSGVDTRALTRHLRDCGTMRGAISTQEQSSCELVQKARCYPSLASQELILALATKEVCFFAGSGPRVVLIDLGSKQNVIRHLQRRNCEVIVVPPTTKAQEIMALNPRGVLLSSGPGDPAHVTGIIAMVKDLIFIGRLPVFGICLGHLLVALALGARTYKMKFGHRGSNHPVKDLSTGKVYITSHNHGFSVEEESLHGLPIRVSHRNLNDHTVEGIQHEYLPVFSVQYHPEAFPGPQESAYLFDQFMNFMG